MPWAPPISLIWVFLLIIVSLLLLLAALIWLVAPWISWFVKWLYAVHQRELHRQFERKRTRQSLVTEKKENDHG